VLAINESITDGEVFSSPWTRQRDCGIINEPVSRNGVPGKGLDCVVLVSDRGTDSRALEMDVPVRQNARRSALSASRHVDLSSPDEGGLEGSRFT
jgi:hypothetical protein